MTKHQQYRFIRQNQAISKALVLFVAIVVAIAGIRLVFYSHAANNGGSGGPLTDQNGLSFTSVGYTSTYNLYAAGLDWTKPVGLLIYADGSGEYGLKNPTSTYLMAGADGLAAVAKRNNMVLLTPLSPNTACADGDGSCWYQGDSVGYTKWAENLTLQVESQYPVDLNRVAMGGYSSGAELSTIWWVPSGAAQRTMTGGVIVAISYGGPPAVTDTATAAFKAKVPINWNVGSVDPSMTELRQGYDYYTNAGFQTSLDIVPNLGHIRGGTFGLVMEGQIKKHVPAATGPTGTPTVTPAATTPTPTPVNPADFNYDGKVNVSDLSLLLAAWGTAVRDLNGDGKTDVFDLSILLNKWTG